VIEKTTFAYIIRHKMKALRYTLLLAAVLITPVVAKSLAPDPPGGSPPPCEDPFGAPCPIDGGISFLVAAGLAYGGKKAYDLNKRKA
jgi:hypothetical protein